MIAVTVSMKPAQRDKLKRLGGAQWVRRKIDAAKEQEQPPSPGAD